jgi:uncharacterized membrane protein YfcA
MNNALFLFVGAVIYIGAGAIGVQLFGEGGSAALFGMVVGSIAFYGFYHLIITKNDDDS